ncbi:MAG: cytochrome c [Gammaproteobacteria bacterium]|nr:cytochrome c [Gammaproteobacteria bacterium]
MNRILTTCAVLLLVGASPLAAAGGDIKNGQTKAEICASCHGADGNSTSPEFPKLAGQHADYIVRALTDYQTGKRSNAIMQGFVANLSQQDMRDLAAYFASQPGSLFTPTNY